MQTQRFLTIFFFLPFKYITVVIIKKEKKSVQRIIKWDVRVGECLQLKVNLLNAFETIYKTFA